MSMHVPGNEQSGDASAARPKRATAAHSPAAAADALTAIPALPAPEEPAIGERRYSFNALLTIGLAGFLLGRLCSR